MEKDLKKYYLAIDIGASSGRHILGYENDGALEMEEAYRFNNQPKEKNGHLVWDTDYLFSQIIAGIKKCKEIGKIPQSIGIDTWGVDYALLDEKDKLIGDVYCYRDSRTEKVIYEVHELISQEELYSKTGIGFQPFNTIYQLYEDKLSGKLAQAKSFLMVPDYFHFLLTGVKKNEYTNATTGGMVNAKSREWNTDIIAKLELPNGLFGTLSAPGTSAKKLKKEIEQEVGFSAEIILPATHDTASAVVCAKEESIYISSGTWSLLGIVTDPILTPEAQSCNYTNEGAAGGKVRFLKNIMGLWIIQCVQKELHEKIPFAALAEMAEKEAVYDWDIDVDDKKFLAPKSMIETIKTQCKIKNQPVPGTAGELAHCVFSSLSKSYARAVTELENITKKTYKSINIIGGGSNNNYLNKLTARATKKTVFSGPGEATAAGNLLVQIMSTDINNAHNALAGLKKKSFNYKEVKCDV